MGNGIESGGELTRTHHQHQHVGDGGDSGRAGPLVEHGQLTEIGTGAQGGDGAPVALHDGLTFDDDKTLVADGALLHENLARIHLYLIAQLGQQRELLAGQ